MRGEDCGSDAPARLAERAPPPPRRVTHAATVRNRYCADELALALEVADGRFVALGFHGRACVLCRAGATAACEALAGQPLEAVGALHAALDAVTAGGDAGPYGGFGILRAHPSREPCVRLALTAIERALAPDPAAVEAGPAEAPSASALHDPWAVVSAWRDRGLGVAVATLVDVVGSSPCPLGSQLVVGSDGAFWGAVSGGCVEGAVVRAATELLAEPGTPRSRLLTFQIANSQAGEVGLACGGEVRIHVGPAPGERLLRAYRQRGRGLARILDLGGGPERIAPDDQEHPRLEGDRFVQPLRAPDRLVLVGGTRVAQVLAQLARPMDFDVQVIEPRAGFATPDRFDVPVHADAPDRVLPRLLGPRTAVVTLTHDARIDDLALGLALPSEAFYVGALGSRKTQQARLARLEAQGIPTERLRGPAGLPIGAQGPSEIALSILAEVVQARRASPAAQAPAVSVGAVVLAAGLSRRAGPVNKLLQPLGGRPLIRHTVEAVLEAGLGPCVVVLGHEADAVRQALEDLPVAFVVHSGFAEGLGRSLAVGIEALSQREVSAAMVVLGDMPYVRPEDLRTLAAAHRPATRHLPVVPVAGEGAARRRGNPVVWPRHAFADLLRLEGDTGAKQLLRRAGGAVIEVPIDHHGVLQDVDGVLPG